MRSSVVQNLQENPLPPSTNIREPETLTTRRPLPSHSPSIGHVTEHKDHKEVEDRRTKKGEARQKEREKYKILKEGKVDGVKNL